MISVRLATEAEADLLGQVAPDVFDHPIDPRWAADFLTDPRHHLAVALDEGVVVGMASAVHYVHPDKAPELWINEAGVAPTHQRKGLATRMLQILLDHAISLGCTAAWVLTEPDNEPARALYSRLGGRPEDTVLYEFALDGSTPGQVDS